jgi:hypothetical protein
MTAIITIAMTLRIFKSFSRAVESDWIDYTVGDLLPAFPLGGNGFLPWEFRMRATLQSRMGQSDGERRLLMGIDPP